MCLHLLANRRCIAVDGHSGNHHYSPLPKPGRMTSNDLYLSGVREGLLAQRVRSGFSGVTVRIDRIFPDGIILLRSMTVGTVYFVTGETFARTYALSG